jgi:HlyD family secretion protein
MKRYWIFYSVGALLVAGLIAAIRQKNGTRTPEAPSTAFAQVGRPRIVVAPGRVEPVSEEIKLGSDLGGTLRNVLVDEGDRVRRGQTVAVLENRDYQARVKLAEAQLAVREAELRRVVNGARPEERREAMADVASAEAALDNARTNLRRKQTLFQTDDVAKADVDRAESEFRVAEAHHQSVTQHHALVDADAREEDRAKAEADVALARAQVEEAEALLDKTIIRSPISGIVLRRYMRAGETVTDSSGPILALADVSVKRVRIDLDETDVAKVRPGQRVYFKAAAYGDGKFWGYVVRVGQTLGKKNVNTGEPAERADTKVLEVLVELQPGADLPPGLRVDAFLIVE